MAATTFDEAYEAFRSLVRGKRGQDAWGVYRATPAFEFPEALDGWNCACDAFYDAEMDADATRREEGSDWAEAESRRGEGN